MLKKINKNYTFESSYNIDVKNEEILINEKNAVLLEQRKLVYDGIQFASGLELYMYKALKEARYRS